MSVFPVDIKTNIANVCRRSETVPAEPEHNYPAPGPVLSHRERSGPRLERPQTAPPHGLEHGRTAADPANGALASTAGGHGTRTVKRMHCDYEVERLRKQLKGVVDIRRPGAVGHSDAHGHTWYCFSCDSSKNPYKDHRSFCDATAIMSHIKNSHSREWEEARRRMAERHDWYDDVDLWNST